jgi:hypothetical protein
VLVPYSRATRAIDREGLGNFKVPRECRIGPPKMYLSTLLSFLQRSNLLSSPSSPL